MMKSRNREAECDVMRKKAELGYVGVCESVGAS